MDNSVYERLPWVAAFILLALNLLKVPLANLMPKVFGHFTRIKELEAETAYEKAAADRQDDIAVMQAMIKLQTDIVRQNDRLLDFVTSRFDARFVELSSTVKEEMAAVRKELSETNERLLVIGREVAKFQAESQVYRHELVSLADRVREVSLLVDKLWQTIEGQRPPPLRAHES